MFCTYCGAQNFDTVAFCQHCGRPMQTGREHQTHFSSPLSPPPPPPGAAIKQRKNRGYVIVIVGAAVALIAYSALPFVSYYSQFDVNLGIAYSPVAETAEEFGSFTQFSALLTFITLIVATVLILTDKPSGTAKTPLVMQRRRRATNAMIGMSVLGILAYILTIATGGSSFDNIDAGFWIYLLGLGTVIIGSIMALRTLSSPLPPPTQLPPQSTPYR